MLPIIALVGRPNVGKSTLFNRLTRTKNALVDNFPGVTRDRQYGQVTFDDQQFIVVDTGGLVADDVLQTALTQQAEQALAEADYIFFLVDARQGLVAGDHIIADQLRQLNKPVELLVNKVDGTDESIAISEFAGFGFSMHAIAAESGRGVHQLLIDTVAKLPASEQLQPVTAAGVKVAIVGRPNVGKSTLINRILGEERMIVCDMPGTTRDSIFVPCEREGQQYTFIDTAGVRRRRGVTEKIEKFSIIKTLRAIELANVVVLVIDASEAITDQDLHLLGFVINFGRALIIAVNKWDGLGPDQRYRIKQELDRRLQFVNYARFQFISALHGSGVGDLFPLIQQAYHSAYITASTAQLSRLLTHAVEKNPPPMVQGRRIKLRYAHLGGNNPPIIVIHGNQTTAVPASYKRYLENFFRKQLKLVGTPVKLIFKTGENPYS